MKKVFLLLMAVVFIFSTAFASTSTDETSYIFSDPSGNTFNYVGNDDSLTFGSNVFHQRAVTGNVILPITWRWNQWIGPSMSQPVVVPLPSKNPDSPSGGVVFTLFIIFLLLYHFINFVKSIFAYIIL